MNKIRVSEKPTYSNRTPIPIGSTVQIIPKDYVKLDINAMMGRLGPYAYVRYVPQEHEDKFEYGILKSIEEVPRRGGAIGGEGGHVDSQKYTVQLDSGEERTFIEYEYYFRVKDAVQSGGFRRKRKMSRKTRRSRKVVRKSRRV
jgi:hypothetical protein